MQKSDTIAELAKALSKFQASTTAVPKLSKNPFFKSNYADLPTIWDHVRSGLTENGLSVVQACGNGGEPFIYTDDKDKISVVHFIEIETMLLHESGEWISDCCRLPLTKGDPQGAGSAITYARRYGLAAMIGSVSDEDDDGNVASGNRTPNANQQSAKPKSQPANNAPMEKALDESKPKDAAKELAEIWGHGAAHAKQSEILGICRDLAAAGDTSLTGHKKLADYVLERFDEPLAKLSVKSVGILIEELTERLDERKAVATEPASDNTPTHSGPDPISPQQLTTLERLCDLKNYSHEDCAVEYSEGEVNALGGLTEQQAMTAIKKVQKMAKIEK